MGARLKVAVVGATGVIGSAVAAALHAECEVVRAARSGADLRVDAASAESVAAFFAALGPFDALVSAIGTGAMGLVERLSASDVEAGLRSKVLAQFNLVRQGLASVRPGGSFTLSSGFLSKEPMPGFSAIAMANAAIDGFCKAAALDLKQGVRINCVSPVFVLESMRAAGVEDISGYVTMSAADTARAYVAAVRGGFSGRDLDPRAYLA